MGKKGKYFLILVCILLNVLQMSTPRLATAEELSQPGKMVREAIEKIRQLVRAEKGKISEEALNKKIEDIIVPEFNFTDMARRSLGPHWEEATADEQKEFVSLFIALMSRTYIGKIRDIEKHDVAFPGDTVRDGTATVRSRVTNDQQEKIMIDYRLGEKDGTWTVYDVIIENVGLVTTYRNEFAGIIRKKQFSGLLEDLRKKKEQRRET